MELQYDLLVDKYANKSNVQPFFVPRCCYGQLQKILVCELPDHEYFANYHKRRLFALVQSCETDGKDASLESVTYTKLEGKTRIIELTAISCVVGRVKIGTGNRWGIIDRSKGLVRPAFIEDPELVDEMLDN